MFAAMKKDSLEGHERTEVWEKQPRKNGKSGDYRATRTSKKTSTRLESFCASRVPGGFNSTETVVQIVDRYIRPKGYHPRFLESIENRASFGNSQVENGVKACSSVIRFEELLGKKIIALLTTMSLESSNLGEPAGKSAFQQEHYGVRTHLQSGRGGSHGPYTILPLPGQAGAPMFDGTDVSVFVYIWENLTLEWSDEQKIKRLVSYCDPMIGKYVKTYDVYRTDDWEAFKARLIEDFKGSDSTFTKKYLHKLISDLKKKSDPSAGDYRAFIMEYSDTSDVLVQKGILGKFNRIQLFLTAFSVKVGDKPIKKCGIDPDDAGKCEDKWEEVKQAAMEWLDYRGSPMRELLREEAEEPIVDEDETPIVKVLNNESSARKEKEKKIVEMMDEIVNLLKELRLQQVEAQRCAREEALKWDLELAELKRLATSTPKPKSSQQLYNPNQYGRPGSQGNVPRIRGCYWDGGMHRRDECKALKVAIERGEVHYQGASLFLGQGGTEVIRVPYPTMGDDGQVSEWQEDWVRKALKTKESKTEDMKAASSVITQDPPMPRGMVAECNKKEYVCGWMNGQPMLYGPSPVQCDIKILNDGGFRKDVREKLKFWQPRNSMTPLNQSEPQQLKKQLKDEVTVEDEIMQDIETLLDLEPKKKGKAKEEEDESKNVPVWMKMRENLDLDRIVHKLMNGEGLNAEEILASAKPEFVQRCTGITKVPKINEIQRRLEKNGCIEGL